MTAPYGANQHLSPADCSCSLAQGIQRPQPSVQLVPTREKAAHQPSLLFRAKADPT
jgi:hypothetical protein